MPLAHPECWAVGGRRQTLLVPAMCVKRRCEWEMWLLKRKSGTMVQLEEQKQIVQGLERFI